MDVLGWILWLVWGLLGILWSVGWFLLGGWVSTLAQIAVIALVIFAMKYGWRRAPQEFVARAAGFGRFAWAWLRSGEVRPLSEAADGQSRTSQARARRRTAARRRQPGDVRINVSTAMSLAMIVGLWLLTAL